MTYYAAIDLHSNNLVLVVLDEEDRIVRKGRLVNDLELVLWALADYRGQLEAVVVESTYNWYWLVDGLQQAGYRVELAHPAGVRRYEGLKHQDDESDAAWLAHLKRLGILPTGYIYPRRQRPLRDLLRRRMGLVRHQTAHVLCLESLYSRCTGRRVGASEVWQLDPAKLLEGEWVERARASLAVLQVLRREIRQIERRADRLMRPDGNYRVLQTIGGVGRVLALTIALETGEVSRFPTAGQYASYCRSVPARKVSNGRKKGEANRRNGNRYLAWAWIEAAHHALQIQPEARRFYPRLRAVKGSPVVARKVLAHKLCRAAYYMMRDQVAYQPARLFG